MCCLFVDLDEWFVKGCFKYDLDLVFFVNFVFINDVLLEIELFIVNFEL